MIDTRNPTSAIIGSVLYLYASGCLSYFVVFVFWGARLQRPRLCTWGFVSLITAFLCVLVTSLMSFNRELQAFAVIFAAMAPIPMVLSQILLAWAMLPSDVSPTGVHLRFVHLDEPDDATASPVAQQVAVAPVSVRVSEAPLAQPMRTDQPPRAQPPTTPPPGAN